jgi:hypothetical protein
VVKVGERNLVNGHEGIILLNTTGGGSVRTLWLSLEPKDDGVLDKEMAHKGIR